MPAVVLLHLEFLPAGRPVDNEDTEVLGGLLDRCAILVKHLGEPPLATLPADDEYEEVIPLSYNRELAGALEDFLWHVVEELVRLWITEIIAAPHRTSVRDVVVARRATVCSKADR